MTTTNTSPYLGYININSNKEYYVSEHYIKDDDFLGRLIIKLDRPANIYIFPTKYDELSGLYISEGNGVFKETDYDYNFELIIQENVNSKFVIILEYDPLKLGISIPIQPEIKFEKLAVGDIYYSDFYMFETRSGIPYPAHDIGTYSRNEFDIQQTSSTTSYKRTGIVYNLTTGLADSNIIVNSANILHHCKTFVQGIMGYNHRPIILEDFPITITGSTIKQAVLANITLIRNKYVQNKIIILAEQLTSKVTTQTDFLAVLKSIMNESKYDVTVNLVDDLIDLSYYYTATFVRAAQEMQDLIDDATLVTKITTFITKLYDSNDASELSELGYTTDLLLPQQCIMVDKLNGGLTHVKSLNEMMPSNVVSGRLDIQGQSMHTGKYASSKILVGHYHENERGYLKHTVATDRYGKTHKDPFVKNKELWGKEEDYIYLDLLHSTKNIFSNSNKIMRGVALLTDKQSKEPPKGTIVFKFWDKDKYDEDQTILEIMPDEIIENVYSWALRAPRMYDFNISGEEFTYILTNKSDYMKVFIREENDTQSYIFWYSQRIGTYIYKFVDESGIKIRDDYIVIKKATHAYEAPQYIVVPDDENIPFEDKLKYRLIEPKGIIYSAAQTKNDLFEYTFKYELITADFIFELMDKDTNSLIEFTDNTILTYRDFNEETKTQLSTTYEISILDSVPPFNKNPIKYENVAKVDYYNAPIYIQIDDYHKYRLPGQSLWLNLMANELNPIIHTPIEYELIKSKFEYSFLYFDGINYNTLINPVEYPIGVKAKHTADNIIHIDDMMDDEYYILDENPINTDPQININNYPTVELKASESRPNISFNYLYKRLTGNIKINYLNTENNEPIDITELKSEFLNVASVTTMESGTEILTGYSQKVIIPTRLEKNKNKVWILDIEKSTNYPKIIITPNNTEVTYNFYYKVIYTNPSIIYNLNNHCEARTYTKYLLLDENQIILGKFDLSMTTFDFNQFGLKIHLDKTVIDLDNGGIAVSPDTIQTSEQKYPNEEIKPDSMIDPQAMRYGVSFKGTFEVDISLALNKKIHLVGFTNLPGDDSTNLHATHDIFTLEYNFKDSDNNKYYAQFIVNDFPKNGLLFTSPVLVPGNKFELTSGLINRGRIFMTIDLSKEIDEDVFEVFKSQLGGQSNLPPQTETLGTFTVG